MGALIPFTCSCSHYCGSVCSKWDFCVTETPHGLQIFKFDKYCVPTLLGALSSERPISHVLRYIFFINFLSYRFCSFQYLYWKLIHHVRHYLWDPDFWTWFWRRLVLGSSDISWQSISLCIHLYEYPMWLTWAHTYVLSIFFLMNVYGFCNFQCTSRRQPNCITGHS